MKALGQYTLIFLVLFILSDKISSKGGRGGGGRGGGGRFGGGSRTIGSRVPIGGSAVRGPAFGGSGFRNPNSYSSYRSGSGMRWASFGAGMLAYSAMSRIASGGYYNRGYYGGSGSGGYPYGTSAVNPKVGTGDECINNEDFNGTKFGKFRCPLPEFDEDAKYCCGSASDETQYCCKFFDDSGRKIGVIVAVIAVFALIVCTFLLISRILNRKRRAFKRNMNSLGNNAGPSIPMPMHINRNINGPSGPRPIYQHPAPPPANRFPDGSNVPLMRPSYVPPTNSSNSPYPTHPIGMPQPMAMPQPMLNGEVNLPPPSYTEAVRFKDGSAPTAPSAPTQ